MNKRKEAIEGLIKKFMEKTSFVEASFIDVRKILAQAASLGKLRGGPGLTESEKFFLVRKCLLALWINKKYGPEEWLDRVVGEDKRVDTLIKFAYRVIGHEAAMIVLDTFGTEDADLIDHLLNQAKTGSGSVAMSLRVLRSCSNCSNEAIDFVVRWAIKENDSQTAEKAASLRKGSKKGLTQHEVEKIIVGGIEKGYIARSIKFANMRAIPGLTVEEIEFLTAYLET